ncbi:hypothetical protein GCM10009636_05670 [Arthrobacter koreensis]
MAGPFRDLTVNCSIMLADLPLLERPAAAAAAGFSAVEFWWPFESPVPGDREVDAFLTAISDAGVRLTGLNFYAGNMPDGERGVLSSPSRSAAFRSSLEATAAIAERTGCRGFNALYGLPEENTVPAAQADCAVENLAAAADAVSSLGGTVLLEPLSGVPGYPLRTAADCFAVLERVHGTGRQNLACWRTSTTWPSTARTYRPSSPGTRRRSGTSSSPTLRDAVPPEPAACLWNGGRRRPSPRATGD